jgi:negative elongation factor E
MVYLHFPTNLTEEELMLQTKYTKLKKKVSNLPLRKISKNTT